MWSPGQARPDRRPVSVATAGVFTLHEGIEAVARLIEDQEFGTAENAARSPTF